MSEYQAQSIWVKTDHIVDLWVKIDRLELKMGERIRRLEDRILDLEKTIKEVRGTIINSTPLR